MASGSDSGPSFNAFNFLEDDEWAESVTEQNRRVGCIIEDVVIHATTLSLQPTNHHVRATRRYIERKCEKDHESVFEQYFSEDPIYPPEMFRTRYVCNSKCTAAMRVLAYGSSTDLHDEYLRMSAQLIRKSVIKFVEGVISNFGDEYLRKPIEEDIATLLHVGERRGFPGILGSIDCIHWEWKNCPTAWAGQYAGRSGTPTIILEAITSQNLWIWHASFGTPGSRNDINVLDQSLLFDDILEGWAPKANYVVNGKEKNMRYYLTDGIYPQWAAIVKSIPAPQIQKHKLFVQHQEAARKDVERAFDVLQARFVFIKRPCLIWDRDIIEKIMIDCIIMHNMIVEDERSTYLNYHDPTEFIEDRVTHNNQQSEEQAEENDLVYSTERIASLSSYMKTRSQLRNRETHNILREDLIEHIWQKFDDRN